MPEPIPMFLTCPKCNARHIDEGDFATKPHHTHSCQVCGLTWRPAVVPTVGVAFLPGFKNEVATPMPSQADRCYCKGREWPHDKGVVGAVARCGYAPADSSGAVEFEGLLQDDRQLVDDYITGPNTRIRLAVLIDAVRRGTIKACVHTLREKRNCFDDDAADTLAAQFTSFEHSEKKP